MTWDYFYQHYIDWAESTQRSRISALEDFGSADEIADCALYLASEKASRKLLVKANGAGIVFPPEEILKLDCTADKELLSELTINTLEGGYSFSAEQISELTCLINDEALSSIVENAVNNGTILPAEQIVELAGLIDTDILAGIVQQGNTAFTDEQKDILDCYIDDEVTTEEDSPINSNQEHAASTESVDGISGALQSLAETLAARSRRNKEKRREHDPDNKKKQRKAHTGLFTAAAIVGELGAAQQKKTTKFRIGDHVRIRYSGQEGAIIDINGPLYMVSVSGGKVDSYYENQLE